MHKQGTMIPTNLYPKGTKVSYHPSIPNDEFDANWSFFSDGTKFMHTKSIKKLHRLDGWAEVGQLPYAHGTKEVFFLLFYSKFDTGVNAEGVHWNDAALQDFSKAMDKLGFEVFPQVPAGLPATPTNLIIERQKNDQVTSEAIGYTYSNTEVEAVVAFNPHTKDRREFRQDLVSQVKFVMGLPVDTVR
jgi:hypothetical protein